MTYQEAIDKYGRYADLLSTSVVKSVIVPRVNELLATTKNRIIRNGENTNGQQIGAYSRKPGYYSKTQFVNKGGFKGVGKNGGTPRKTMYLPQGYYQFRSIQGREVNKVNVNLSGDTMNRYQISVRTNEIVMGMTTQKAANIRKGNEKRFRSSIYPSTKQELATYNANVASDLGQVTREIFQ